MKRTRASEHTDRIIREAIVQLLALRLASGADVHDLKEFALTCANSAAADVPIGLQSGDRTTFYSIASVLRAWHRETKYLSKDGFPRPLNLNGKGGFRPLASRFYPTDKFDELFASLKRAGLIRRTPRGQWVPGGKHAILPYLSSEMLDHIADGVARFVETVTQNVLFEDKERSLFERASKVRKFPASKLPLFRKFVAQQATAFLVTVDEWAEAHAEAAAKSRERKCAVGAFTFAFVEDTPSMRKRRRT